MYEIVYGYDFVSDKFYALYTLCNIFIRVIDKFTLNIYGYLGSPVCSSGNVVLNVGVLFSKMIHLRTFLSKRHNCRNLDIYCALFSSYNLTKPTALLSSFNKIFVGRLKHRSQLPMTRGKQAKLQDTTLLSLQSEPQQYYPRPISHEIPHITQNG